MDELLLQVFGLTHYTCFKFPVLFAAGGGSGSGSGDEDDEENEEDGPDDDPGDDPKDDSKPKNKGKKDTKKPPNKDDKPDDAEEDEPPASKKTFDEDYVKGLRAEAAKYRKEKKEEAKKADKLDAQLKAIQKALGLEDEEPDATKLEKELGDLKNKLKEERLHNRFMRAAIKAEADPELTYAYLKYRGDLDDLDVDDDSFGKELKVVIKEALEANPKLKAGKESPRKSGDDQSDDKGGKGGFNMNDLIRKAAGRG